MEYSPSETDSSSAKMHFNIILQSTTLSSKWFCPSGFLHQILLWFFFFPVCATCPPSVIAHNFIILIIPKEEYKSWSSSIWNLLYHPVASSLLRSNIFLSIPFSNTLCFEGWDQVGHLYETTGKIAFINLYICKQQNGRQKILDQTVASIPQI